MTLEKYSKAQIEEYKRFWKEINDGCEHQNKMLTAEVTMALANMLQGRTMLEFYDYVCEMSDVDNLARKKIASLPDNTHTNDFRESANSDLT